MTNIPPTSFTVSQHPHMQLRCVVNLALLNLLRDFICQAARTMQFPEHKIAEIEISVDEACANAMEHAYAAQPETSVASDATPPEIHVELFMAHDRLTIRISDHGTGHLESDCPTSMDSYLDIHREKFRGLGLVLMRKFMDGVTVTATPGEGTIVEMTKFKY